jgi:fructose-1,6-bisphosphatase/inositol monophosphatase family enzyme
LILLELAPSIKSFDLGVLTEESVDDSSRLEKDYFWCIDPIDGTLAFTRDTKGYSVSIALISKSGEPIIGVVYNPVDKDLYSGAKGLGVLKNGKKWTPSKKQKSTFICDPTFVGHPKYDSTIEEFKKERTSKVEIIAIGGAVMNAIWTIENAPALYAKAPKPKKGGGSIWDYAATTCIYRELGLEAGDYEGNNLSFNNPETIYFNHCGIRFSSL